MTGVVYVDYWISPKEVGVSVVEETACELAGRFDEVRSQRVQQQCSIWMIRGTARFARLRYVGHRSKREDD